MAEEFHDEIQAINSIYGADTLRKDRSPTENLYILSLPVSTMTLRITIPTDYPTTSPHFVGIQSTDKTLQKGRATKILGYTQEALARVFIPGSVCLFDVLQELEHIMASDDAQGGNTSPPRARGEQPEHDDELMDNKYLVKKTPSNVETFFTSSPPAWTTSEPLTIKKSAFLARACAVSSAAEARAAVAHLMRVDKKVAKATHNITAYRIRASPTVSKFGRQSSQHQQLIFQDCEDDGESAAGGRLLHLLQIMDVWGLLVVVSRWYGGVKLGPDRFRCISEVAREAIIMGGWIKNGAR